MRVKICGIRSLDEAKGVIEAGADALGFHIELEHSRCLVAAAAASGIISKLPPFISSVVVTSETDPKELSDDSIAIAKNFENSADTVILDSVNKETGARGGTGKTHDWSISKKIVESTSLRVILAGGFNPAHVVDPIRSVPPYAVPLNPPA